MPPKRATVTKTSSSSPGGTKTIDFTVGGFQDDADQAQLLDDLLAEEADNHFDRESTPWSGAKAQPGGGGGGGGGSAKKAMGLKPSQLAAKYGVDYAGEDSDDSDFGPDDDEDGCGGAKGGGLANQGGSPGKMSPGRGNAADFEFGAMAEMAQENSQLRSELDERRQQV